MQRCPDIFCIGIEEAEPKKWHFKLLASPIAQPADGGHAQASGSQAVSSSDQHPVVEPAAVSSSDLMASMAPPPGLSDYAVIVSLVVTVTESQQDSQSQHHHWQPMALVPPHHQWQGGAVSRAEVRHWSVFDVVQFLDTLALGHLAERIYYEGLDGPTLIELLDKNRMEVMFTQVQAMKIIAHIAAAEPANGGDQPNLMDI